MVLCCAWNVAALPVEGTDKPVIPDAEESDQDLPPEAVPKMDTGSSRCWGSGRCCSLTAVEGAFEECCGTTTEVENPNLIRAVIRRPGKGENLGLGVDFVAEGNVMMILRVSEGPVTEYNQTVPEDRRIRPGLFILSVNDKEDDVQTMWDELTTADKVELKLAPKEEFTVTVKKQRPYAMDLAFHPNSNFLLIKGIKDGPLASYNHAAKDASKKVKGMDLIMEVNGTRGGASKLVQALRESEEVEMTVVRPML